MKNLSVIITFCIFAVLPLTMQSMAQSPDGQKPISSVQAPDPEVLDWIQANLPFLVQQAAKAAKSPEIKTLGPEVAITPAQKSAKVLVPSRNRRTRKSRRSGKKLLSAKSNEQTQIEPMVKNEAASAAKKLMQFKQLQKMLGTKILSDLQPFSKKTFEESFSLIRAYFVFNILGKYNIDNPKACPLAQSDCRKIEFFLKQKIIERLTKLAPKVELTQDNKNPLTNNDLMKKLIEASIRDGAQADAQLVILSLTDSDDYADALALAIEDYDYELKDAIERLRSTLKGEVPVSTASADDREVPANLIHLFLAADAEKGRATAPVASATEEPAAIEPVESEIIEEPVATESVVTNLEEILDVDFSLPFIKSLEVAYLKMMKTELSKKQEENPK